MCFKTRWASTRDYTVFRLLAYLLKKGERQYCSLQKHTEISKESTLLEYFELTAQRSTDLYKESAQKGFSGLLDYFSKDLDSRYEKTPSM